MGISIAVLLQVALTLTIMFIFVRLFLAVIRIEKTLLRIDRKMNQSHSQSNKT